MTNTKETKVKLKPSLFSKIRTYFLTGIVVAAPITVTGWVAIWFIQSVDGWFSPFAPDSFGSLPFSIPGFGIISAFIILTLLGALTSNFFGNAVINYGERLVDRLPIIRNIYGALKQIFQTIASKSDNNFQRVVMLEYPRKDCWAIAFVTTEAKGEIKANHDKELLCVFLPTTPNPTSGFLLFVPKEEVIELDMSVESAAKLIISAGLVMPEKKS
ncbi:MAG: DUF502 domain-containing protein [Alphaproteobacteria bacterium]|nr:DUF502 domain-containing protein [Rhodobiaceae bacterium]MDC0184727.1 DUF502 domain-containing protein [Rhodobiaceae bacterium]|tara:strand:- start:84 stop:728 length:645 start_codon:yes stop_codon:yes gene_type:complete